MANDDNVKIDYDGMGEILRSGDMANALYDIAQDVGGRIDQSKYRVTTHRYITDRAAASVTLAQSNAMFIEARDGVLRQAAAAAGLQVTDGGVL